jgi:hypothetical protein
MPFRTESAMSGMCRKRGRQMKLNEIKVMFMVSTCVDICCRLVGAVRSDVSARWVPIGKTYRAPVDTSERGSRQEGNVLLGGVDAPRPVPGLPDVHAAGRDCSPARLAEPRLIDSRDERGYPCRHGRLGTQGRRPGGRDAQAPGAEADARLRGDRDTRRDCRRARVAVLAGAAVVADPEHYAHARAAPC